MKKMTQSFCNKYFIFKGLLSSALCACMLSGCALLPQEEEVLAPPLKEPTAVTYTTSIVETGDISDSINAGGSFIPTISYDLSFGTRSGYLSELAVRVGDQVTEGQVLARLESEDLELSIAQQELSVKRARLAYEKALEDASIDSNTVKKAALAVESAHLELAKMKDDYEIHPSNELKIKIGQQEIAFALAQEAYNEVMNSTGEDSYSVQMAKLDLESAQLNLNRSKEELERLTIRSPIDGVVSYTTVTTIGEYIPGRSTAVRVIDPSELLVHCTGDKVKDLPLGVEVELTYLKQKFTGKVVMTTLDKPADLEISESFIRVSINEELPFDHYDLIGKAVTVELIKDKKTDVIIVPSNTIYTYGTDHYVYVLEDGVRKERPVTLGIETPSRVEIVDGLEVGEEIIIK